MRCQEQELSWSWTFRNRELPRAVSFQLTETVLRQEFQEKGVGRQEELHARSRAARETWAVRRQEVTDK
jgi:hypothetical protein